MTVKKFYITTPIYYATAKPHLGSLYSTLVADFLARWRSLCADNVFFLTGTDEYGQKIAKEAANLGITEQALVDRAVAFYKDVWQQYGINYSYFVRTTDKNHQESVRHWITLLQEKGAIYKGVYAGWYCTPCETFITDIAEEQAEKRCPSCNRPVEKVEEETYFFRLSAYQQQLLDFYEQHPDFIQPKERMHEVISFVKEGLKDLSISRKTVSWGIPFPGDDKHVVYVWADALNNYISSIGYADPNKKDTFNYWWPADVQVIGKDIVKFHAVFWPAFLMATGLALPKHLLVHGWIKIGDQKMSKSLGNSVDPAVLAQTYDVDAIRYYLLRYMAITHDSPFSLDDMEHRINTDLANDLGNLLNRMVLLAQKNNTMIIPSMQTWSPESIALMEMGQVVKKNYEHALKDMMLHVALAEVWKYVHAVNSYFHKKEPWKCKEHEQDKFIETIAAVSNSLCTIAVLIAPVMPQIARKIMLALGDSSPIDAAAYKTINMWNKSFILHVIPPLFNKIEPKKMVETTMQDNAKESVKSVIAENNEISIQDFAKVELRVGTIIECTDIPGSEKLLRLQVDFGVLGKRQILSGIKTYYKPDMLIGRQAVFVYNLPTRKMMGFDSQGMLIIAKDTKGIATIVSPLVAVENGSSLS